MGYLMGSLTSTVKLVVFAGNTIGNSCSKASLKTTSQMGTVDFSKILEWYTMDISKILSLLLKSYD